MEDYAIHVLFCGDGRYHEDDFWGQTDGRGVSSMRRLFLTTYSG